MRRRHEAGVTPAELDAVRADIERARADAAAADAAAAASSARWPTIHRIREAAREIRARNHLAEDLRTIFRGS